MSTLRISDAPLLPDVDGTEKIPTGGRGDYAISVDQIKDHIFQDIGKELVGLGNVDNTSDLDKPVSTAQQTALNLKANKTYVDTNLALKADKTNVYTRSETSLALNQKADLVNGVVPESQIPSSFNDVLEFTTPNLPIVGESGKIYVTTDNNKTWRWGGNKYVEISGWNPDSVSKSVTLPTYYAKEDGVDPVTGITNGAYFNVRSEDDDTVAIEYQNVSGSAVATGKSYPSSAYIQILSEALNGVSEVVAQPFEQSREYTAGQKALIMSGAGVRSLEDNNTTDPNTDMSKWAFIEHLIFKSRDEMLSYANPKTGQVAHLLSFHALNFALLKPQDGGGFFIYDESKATENNGGTIFNGWIRQYSGDVDISWFGAVQGADASPFIESALKISKSVVIRGNYTLETICGIPDQNNYSDTVIRIRGENQATLTINCPSGAVFTSTAAKADPSNLADLYTGKINVSGINFIGTTVANSVIFNGDRLYNMYIHHNNFKGSVTIIKAYLKRLGSRQYTQSTDISYNHMANVYRVIEADRAYNFSFEFNACENCYGGMYIGVDAPSDPSGMSVSIFRNLWESSGLFFKSNGGIVAGSISKNYFESNNIDDAATDKCQIYISRTGEGAGHSGGLVFDSNFFSGSAHVTGYCDVRLVGTPDITGGTTRNAVNAPAVFIGNWSENDRLVDNPSAILIGNRVKNRALMRNTYTPQEARVSFFSGSLTKAVTGSSVRFMTIDTRPCLATNIEATNFKASIDVMLNFTTIGAVNTASAAFKLDVFVYTPFGAWSPPKAGFKAVMSGFMQSTSSDKVIDTVNMASVIETPTLSVIDNGDGTYHLDLSTFSNYIAPNWGGITELTVTYNVQGSGYLAGNYSSLNLLGIS